MFFVCRLGQGRGKKGRCGKSLWGLFGEGFDLGLDIIIRETMRESKI